MNALSQYLLLFCSLLVFIQTYALPVGEDAAGDDDLTADERMLLQALETEGTNQGDIFSRLQRSGAVDGAPTFSRDRRRACVSDCSFCHSFFTTYKLGNCFHGCRVGFHDMNCQEFRF